MRSETFLRLGAAALLSFAAGVAAAAGVSVKFDLSSPDTAPFPSDRFTVPDFSQRTFRRVALPQPDCAVRPSDCADIDVLNTLDGFNTQPRITVPFTGPIDVSTVNSNTVYLVNLGDTLTLRGFGERVGINQVVWDPATNTLVFESDQLLAEHSRYLLVITNGVRDAAGDPIEPGRFGRFRHDLNFGQTHDRALKDYRKALLDGMHSAAAPRDRIVALSLFTTRTTTGTLEKIRQQIKASTPAPVNFMVGNNGTERALFPVSSITAIQFNRQIGTAPTFNSTFLPTPALNVVPGAVAAVAYGKFNSPDYQTPAKFIPPVPTLLGQPRPQGTNELVVQIFLPAGVKPAGGWPVAIFGHGFTDSMYGAPWVVASVFAAHGIATASINVVGHGGGALGNLTVIRASGAPVVVPAGGRGIDQDGNGTIDSTEGVNAAPPATIVGSSDGLRQTAIDLMQLVRQIEVGIDVDGDG
ncbi:MAG TPA: Ig-like domain-containing protein, partial [Burkholderiaceae bacterium]|nr:Ig-like domain-containing protein [Burkholderiaceae bacterium]